MQRSDIFCKSYIIKKLKWTQNFAKETNFVINIKI